MKNRLIDLQLVKPVKPDTPAAKGKISILDLVKEVLDTLQVPYANSCCTNAVPCPPISAAPDNTAQCLDDGIYVPPAPEAVNENPFTNLFYTNASLYSQRFFTANGITVIEPSNWTTGGGSGISFTMGLTDFAGGGFLFAPSAGTYTIQFPTGTDIASYMGITAPGAFFEWTVVNGGTNTVTFTVNTDVVAASVVTGGTTLTVASGRAATFKFYAITATSFQVSRVA